MCAVVCWDHKSLISMTVCQVIVVWEDGQGRSHTSQPRWSLTWREPRETSDLQELRVSLGREVCIRNLTSVTLSFPLHPSSGLSDFASSHPTLFYRHERFPWCAGLRGSSWSSWRPQQWQRFLWRSRCTGAARDERNARHNWKSRNYWFWGNVWDQGEQSQTGCLWWGSARELLLSFPQLCRFVVVVLLPTNLLFWFTRITLVAFPAAADSKNVLYTQLATTWWTWRS